MTALPPVFHDLASQVHSNSLRIAAYYEEEFRRLREEIENLEEKIRQNPGTAVANPGNALVGSPFSDKQKLSDGTGCSVQAACSEPTAVAPPGSRLPNLQAWSNISRAGTKASRGRRVVHRRHQSHLGDEPDVPPLTCSKVAALTSAGLSRDSDGWRNLPVIDPAKSWELPDPSKQMGWAKFSSCLDGARVELLCCVMICLNTIQMAVEMQYNGLQLAFEEGFDGYSTSMKDRWQGAGQVFYVLEIVFTSAFTFELVLRIAAGGLHFFKRALNWLDVVVVAAGLITFVNFLGDFDPWMIRLLRLARLGRALRVFKMTTVLSSLQLILKSLAGCVHALGWSLMLILVIQMIAGMFVGQLVVNYLSNDNVSIDDREDVFRYYGTFTRTFFTMFEVTLANWAPAARILTSNVSESYSLFFVFYRCLVGFAVLNVINAIFVQQTLKVAQSDEDVMISQKAAATQDFARKLQKLFDNLDASQDGLITWDEFKVVMVDPKIKAFMQALEIDVTDLERLFDFLDTGDGEISVDDFAQGVSKIKGPAKNIDLVQLLALFRRFEERFDDVFGFDFPRVPAADVPVAKPDEVRNDVAGSDVGVCQI